MECIFECELEPTSSSSIAHRQEEIINDSLLQGLQSVLRKVYVAEAVLHKRLETSSSTEEAHWLTSGLKRLGEVEDKIYVRIHNHINLITPCDSEEE